MTYKQAPTRKPRQTAAERRAEAERNRQLEELEFVANRQARFDEILLKVLRAQEYLGRPQSLEFKNSLDVRLKADGVAATIACGSSSASAYTLRAETLTLEQHRHALIWADALLDTVQQHATDEAEVEAEAARMRAIATTALSKLTSEERVALGLTTQEVQQIRGRRA